jgi:hypothetical protein
MIGIYCRISKHKAEGKDVSIETQLEQGIAYAKSEGLEYKSFIDRAISGTKDEIKDRPEFALLLDSINKGIITKVFCFDQSRIERNSRIWNLFVYTMQKAKCQYYPGGTFLDLDVPANRLFTGIISLTNEFYSTLTGQKVKLAHYKNSLKGKSHGITAYGYIRDENGLLKIHEEQAKVIRRIFKMSGDGIGVYTIAKKLNEEGIPTKFNDYSGQFKRRDKYTNEYTYFRKADVRWRGNVVYLVLTNQIYKGIRKWNSGENETKVPAIIDEATWDSVNKNLEENKKKPGKRDEYHYLLNGLVFCGICGKEYRGKKRLKGRDNAYKCKSKLRDPHSCTSRALSIPKLETFIIKHLFISKDLQKFLAGQSENKAETDNLNKKLAVLKKEIESFKKAEKKAYDRLLDPEYEDDEEIKERLRTIKKKIQDHGQNIEIIDNKLIERDSKSRVARINNVIGQYKLESGFEDTKKLVHALIKKITIKYNIKESGKGGYFMVHIEYRGFDESITFMTDRNALKWYQLGYYRSRAITKEDMQDDIDLLKYFIKASGKKIEVPKDFVGFEAYGGGKGESIIELKPDELIYFD